MFWKMFKSSKALASTSVRLNQHSRFFSQVPFQYTHSSLINCLLSDVCNNSNAVTSSDNASMSGGNFYELVTSGLNFVDKSLLIKDVIDDKKGMLAIITRPRYFAKTTNLSMLYHFFSTEANGKSTRGLFNDLKIAKVGEGDYIKKHQGKYPAVYITFEDIQGDSYESAAKNIRRRLIKVFKQHDYLLDSSRLESSLKKEYKAILSSKTNLLNFEMRALPIFTRCLSLHHGKKTCLFVDGYDTPLQVAYTKNYLEDLKGSMRRLFNGLSTNPYVYRAVITGILHIFCDPIFNQEAHGIFDYKHGQYFGFTEDEVESLFIRSGLTVNMEEIKEWYGGYQIGSSEKNSHDIFNPYSITKCISCHGKLDGYWVNTSNNMFIKKGFKSFLTNTSLKTLDEIDLDAGERPNDNNFMKTEIVELLQDKEIYSIEPFFGNTDETLDVYFDRLGIWPLLAMAGYLTVRYSSKDGIMGYTEKGVPGVSVDWRDYRFKIPNRELFDFYEMKSMNKNEAVKCRP